MKKSIAHNFSFSNKRVQVIGFLMAALTWLLFIFSASALTHLSWYPIIFFGRAILLVVAVAAALFQLKNSRRNLFSYYCLICMLYQSYLACLEPSNQIEFYQYVSYFFLASALSFEGRAKEWRFLSLPIIFIASVVPLFFKDTSLFSSIGVFAFTFTTPIALSIISTLIIMIVAEKYSALIRNAILNHQLLESETEKKREIEVEMALLKEALVRETRRSAAGEVAAQVAHDIQSPLAALYALVPEMSSLPEETRFVATSAIDRIKGISRDLATLSKDSLGDTKVSELSEASFPKNVVELVEAVLAEKRVRYRDRQNLKIDLSIRDSFISSELRFDSTEFQRIISNLVNNAAEAIPMSHAEGLIRVCISSSSSELSIEISDNGRGIPKKQQANLGQRGHTFGKENGLGLGLFHARTTVESWGGILAIQSEHGRGTRVKLSLPLQSSLAAPSVQNVDAVLIDDDKLLHHAWLLAAKRKGKVVKAFASPQEFFENSEFIDKHATIYIDSDLGSQQKGEVVAESIFAQGFEKILLATGRPSSSFKEPMPWIKGITGKEPPFLQA